ncbi:restriction endonuclease subunit S [Empedobacter falsenii]
METYELVNSLIIAKKRLVNDGKISKKKDSLPKHEKPFMIPDSWIWVQLSDVSIIQEGPGIRKHQYKDEGVQFLTVTNILDGSLDLEKSEKYISESEYLEKYQHFTINEGDIVTACSGATWGKSAMFEGVDFPMILNTSTLRLRFFDDICNNKYLYYYTKNHYFKKQLSIYQTGQQPNYGYSHYSLIHVPIPPLKEQQQIVEKLDQAFELIDQAKANIEQNIINAKELFQSKLDEVFSQKGDGWEINKLSKCCNIINGYAFPGSAFSADKTVKCVKITNVGVRKFVEDTENNLDSEFLLKNKEHIVNTNDIVIALTRTIISEGVKVAKVPDSYNNSLVNQRVAVLKNSGVVSTDFIYYFLISGIVKRYVINHVNTLMQPNLSINDLKNLEVTFPLSLEKQNEVVETLENLNIYLDNLHNTYQQKLANLEELRKSILEKAFRGELTN